MNAVYNRTIGYCRLGKQDDFFGFRYIKINNYLNSQEDGSVPSEKRNNIIQDIDGTKFKELQEMILRPGDVLLVVDLKDLGFATSEIYKNLKWLVRNNIEVKFIEMPKLSTKQTEDEMVNDKINKAVLSALLNISAIEDENAIHSKLSGRPKTIVDFGSETFKQNYRKWKEKEITSKQFIRILDISHTTFYEKIKEYEEAKTKENGGF